MCQENSTKKIGLTAQKRIKEMKKKAINRKYMNRDEAQKQIQKKSLQWSHDVKYCEIYF